MGHPTHEPDHGEVPPKSARVEDDFESHLSPTRTARNRRLSASLPFAVLSILVVATVAFGVRNFPERERNFAEVLRVLKPGVRYVILEFSRPPFALWRGVYHVYLRGAIPLIGGMLTGDRAGFVYLNDSIRQFPAQAQLAAELRKVGFTTISWKDLTIINDTDGKPVCHIKGLRPGRVLHPPARSPGLKYPPRRGC